MSEGRDANIRQLPVMCGHNLRTNGWEGEGLIWFGHSDWDI
jgi:hypothetical protein